MDEEAAAASSSSFPEVDLIPKQETHVLSFLKEHPEYDGRNVRIGILDSGIDVGSSLALMGDGTTTKLENVIDCGGSGDVDVSTVVPATWVEEGNHWTVKGLTGREYKLSAEWTFAPFPEKEDKSEKKDAEDKTKKEAEDEADPSKKEDEDAATKAKTVPIRVGVKRGYDLYAAPLKRRLQQERQAVLDSKIATYEAAVRQKLAAWTELHGGATTLDSDKLRQRDEWQAQLDILSAKEWQDDPGPLYDCLVFYDGIEYRAWVVSDEADADLRTVAPLAAYGGVSHDYGTLGVRDQLNYAVQFYENGTVLSIVADSSPHGTHVAGICAAADKADPDRNGVAPGATLVSLKIGDARMAGMETGSALSRAFAAAIRLQCDVINMSYGEAAAVANSGRLTELANELVWKHGIEFVSSAGNSGPALSTAGAPGASASCCLGVAAYVSPQMAQVLYSMPLVNDNKDGDNKVTFRDEEEFPGSTYTWSSVGPALDGDTGVHVMAPGGAIAPVSSWCLKKTQLMNGTSMSSPHATGCVALLISACKAHNMAVSPARLRRALRNTCHFHDDLSVVEQGAGMIQVDKAWEYLVQTKDVPFEEVHYHVSIDNAITGTSTQSPRGIYLRQPHETTVEQSFVIHVEPQWPTARRLEVTQEAQQARLTLETQLQLTVRYISAGTGNDDSPKDWVQCPANFVVMSGGRTFKVLVDPSKLPPGLHTAQVVGTDLTYPQRGVLFTVPITICKPQPPMAATNNNNKVDLGALSFAPTHPVRRFFLVPPLGATWMDVVLTDGRQDTTGTAQLVGLHTVQLLPHAAFRDYEKHENLFLRPQQTVVTSVPVEAGVTIEIALSRYWSTLGDTTVAAVVHFRGVVPTPNHVTLTAGQGGPIVHVTSHLATESILPKASLTHCRTPLRPKAGAVVAPTRDVFPLDDDIADETAGRPIHQLILQYEFTQEAEKGASITPRIPAVQGVLYESGLESQLVLIFDNDKKLLGTCDAWPSAVSVPKGKIVLRLLLRHEQPAKLEKLKDLVLWVERSLDTPISLQAFPSQEALVVGSGQGPFKKRVLKQSKSAAIFWEEPPASKLPSYAKPGDVLQGSFTVAAGSDESALGAGKRPGGFPIQYVVGPKADKAPSDPEPAEPKDTRTAMEKMKEAVRDTQVAQLSKLTSSEKEEGQFDVLYEALLTEYSTHLPLRLAKLKYLDAHAQRLEKLPDIVTAAQAVLDLIDETALALHFGKKSDSDNPAAVRERKEMKEKKTILTEALARLAMAHASLARQPDAAEDEGKNFNDTLTKLKEWIDIDSTSTDKYAQIVMERDERAGRWGCVLKMVNKLLAKGELKDKDYLLPITKNALYEKRVQLLQKLGFEALVQHDQMTRLVACPPSHALF